MIFVEWFKKIIYGEPLSAFKNVTTVHILYVRQQSRMNKHY